MQKEMQLLCVLAVSVFSFFFWSVGCTLIAGVHRAMPSLLALYVELSRRKVGTGCPSCGYRMSSTTHVRGEHEKKEQNEAQERDDGESGVSLCCTPVPLRRNAECYLAASITTFLHAGQAS
jgi:hypothetical protein